MAVHKLEIEIAGRTLSLETGRVAGLADGAVLVTYGDSALLATAVSSPEPREGIDFFPLTVEYEERMYAAGKIPGGFIKREGRPGEQAILSARLTDRPIRPLFPKYYRNDVQIVNLVMSADQVNDPAILSIIGASAALHLSSIPFQGPVAAVRMGYIDGQLVVNPTMRQLYDESELELTVAGTRDAVLMVEAGAHELPEGLILEAIMTGHRAMQPLIDAQEKLRELAGKPKQETAQPPVDEELKKKLQKRLDKELEAAIYNPDKGGREDATRDLRKAVLTEFAEAGADPKEVSKLFDSLEKDLVRTRLLDGKRPDGRGTKDIRPISIEVGVLPRAHGSGLFTRGQTQVMSVATLGTGWAFYRYRRRVASSGATLLAVSFALWGLHHLDYPFLRARGAWTPWGYYLDIVFTLAIGAGILLLLLDDLRGGLSALSPLSGDLQSAGRAQDVLSALLARPLTLPAVRGSAIQTSTSYRNVAGFSSAVK